MSIQTQHHAMGGFNNWSAIDGNTYDITGIDEDGRAYSNHPIGWGRTEAEAIADLKEQMEEH